MNKADTPSLHSAEDGLLPLPPSRKSGKRIVSIAIAFVSGLLLTLAFPPANVGWVAFIALVPFLSLFPFDRARTAFAHGFAFGLAYFCGLLYWIEVFAGSKIGGFGVAAWFILSAREAYWVGLFAIATNLAWNRVHPFWRTFVTASAWTVFEWIRQLGPLGFGWGDLGYSQWKFLSFIHIAAFAGVWGVSWLIILINSLLASKQKIARLAAPAILAVFAMFPLEYLGGGRAVDSITASSLQANIFEDVPYDGLRPVDRNYFYGTLQEFDRMAEVAHDRDGAAICVTAETSVPGYPLADPELRMILSSIARRHHVILIVGARATDPASLEDTNSVFVFLPDGTMTGPYSKQQLVPFGEYVPFRKQLPFLNAFHVLDYDMQAGRADQNPLNAGSAGKVGIAVCYESTYPRFICEQVRRGATFDVVVTDDAWYGRTAAAEQHLSMSILRAVETDRYLVRCASTGISAVIDPNGRILNSAPLFIPSVVSARISPRQDLTPFVRFGDWWVGLSFLIYLGPFIIKGRRNRSSDTAS